MKFKKSGKISAEYTEAMRALQLAAQSYNMPVGEQAPQSVIAPEDRSKRSLVQQFDDHQLRRLIARIVQERYKTDLTRNLEELPRSALIGYCQELGI